MTSSVTSSADVPAWDTPPTITTKPARPVPDDWDADDPEEESAKDIWERARSYASNPVFVEPAVDHSPACFGHHAFYADTSATQVFAWSVWSGSGNPGNGAKTMKEREAEYKAARDRILPIRAVEKGQVGE
ncbi:SUZ domain protein [Ceratobasidium sp. AG-Ba]|nr:SUZ domain protein [Ceratobasidium sp. AG-Ba]